MSPLFSHLLLVLGMLLVLPAAVLLLQERRTPQSVLAWLLFFLTVPYLAIPAFLMLGVRKRRRSFPDFAARLPVTAVPFPMAERLRRLGAPPALEGNQMDLLVGAACGHAALFALLDAAQSSIDATFYVLEDDAVGRAFVDRLTASARQGVAVRLFIDRIGSMRPPRAALGQLRAAGGQVRFHSPLLHLPGRRQLNLRNHRKMLIVDGVRVFAGGMNIGVNYLTDSPTEATFDDLGFCLHGPGAAAYANVFAADWGGAEAGVPEIILPPAVGSSTVQLVPSGPDVAHDVLHDALVDVIHRAERRVWIATPYFVPTPALAGALSAAARAKVDVRVLLPRCSNQRVADWVRGGFLRALAADGCQVHLLPHMLHAKVGVVDDLGWLGSANFDIRSMLINYECALFVHDTAQVELLQAWFETRLSAAPAGVPVAGLSRRLLEGVFRLGAPML